MSHKPRRTSAVLAAIVLLSCLPSLAAQDDAGEVRLTHRTSETQLRGDDGPNFTEDFGIGVAPLGDFDGDGIEDLAVLGEDALWLVFLDEQDRPHSWSKLDLTAMQLGRLSSITALGDLNTDGVPDFAIGASSAGVSGSVSGAVLILFLAADGTALSSALIAEGLGGFAGGLSAADQFGDAIACLGDLDGDGVPDLAVSAPRASFGCDPLVSPPGEVWILFLDHDGSVKNSQPIGDGLGGLQAALTGCSNFGDSLSWGGRGGAGGAPQLAVGGKGLIWIFSLAPDGTVTSERTLSPESFGAPPSVFVGRTVAWLGDVDHDGVDDLAFGRRAFGTLVGTLGAPNNLWVVLLAPDGSTKDHVLMVGSQGGYTYPTSFTVGFPTFLTSLPDRDGDGVRELLASSAGPEIAEAFVLDNFAIFYLNDGFATVPRKVGVNQGIPKAFGSSLLGSSVASLGDLDGDGLRELAIGVPGDTTVFGGTAGAVWIVSLAADGSAINPRKLAAGQPGVPPGLLDNARKFGTAVEALGDLDGDGHDDLLVGGSIVFGPTGGDAWVLFLEADGSVRNGVELASQFSGFPDTLSAFDQFGASVATLGDLDGDGVQDIAVGAPGSTFFPSSVWILFLEADASIRSIQQISAGIGGLGAGPQPGDRFGHALATLGDVDGDGTIELAVGAPGRDDGGKDRGAVWILSLGADGKVVAEQTLSQTTGGFPGTLADDDAFGSALAFGPPALGEPQVLAVGAPGLRLAGAGTPGPVSGAVWLFWPARPGTLSDPWIGARFLRLDGQSIPYAGVDIDTGDALGSALAWVGDVDGNGTHELAVGAPGDDEGAFEIFVFPEQQVEIGAVWITSPITDHWRNLGGGLAGTAGIPQLVGRGALVSGDEVELHLSQALPGSSAALVAGTARADIPFLGGVLVPRPDRILLGLPVDAHGTHTYRRIWRAPLPGLVAYHFQFLVIDPLAPQGVASSNAVVALFP